MVFVIDEDSRSRDISEAILAKLRFAVAPFESLDKAISVLQALRPEVVIAREDHIDRLRATLAHQRGGMIPLVPITKDQGGEALVEEVRRVLRDRAAV